MPADLRVHFSRLLISSCVFSRSGGTETELASRATGPEHYAVAERLLALADRYTKGVTYDQEWTLTLTAAQVHATLALAAVTAVGTAGLDGHAWADVAAIRLSARKPEPSPDSSPGSDPLSRRPCPVPA
jgi:hypothetical protein